MVRAWERKPEVDRDYWWGGVGKSAERCAWGHAALEEFSQFAGVASATAAAELSKFYEHIEHQLLIDEAVASGYPLAPQT